MCLVERLSGVVKDYFKDVFVFIFSLFPFFYSLTYSIQMLVYSRQGVHFRCF